MVQLMYVYLEILNVVYFERCIMTKINSVYGLILSIHINDFVLQYLDI